MNLFTSTLEKRYQIGKQLGEGGMSYVFEGFDLETKCAVAVKWMKERVTSTYFEDLTRFRKEIEIISKFSHPHIVKVYNAGEYMSKPYIVMELLQGESLADLLQRNVVLSEQQIVKIIQQLVEALHYVHRHGIIHRDLKPSNIFLSQTNAEIGDIKLLDFGIAHVMELVQISSMKEIAGTFGYMSPEATGILNKQIDERSDLYSLGAVLYHLCTGCLPFEGFELNRLLHQQVACLPKRPSQINAGVSAVALL